jgi:sterol desaturase/sphingolipid hydroxylase (fatty acid hydroxylase superfamily)
MVQIQRLGASVGFVCAAMAVLALVESLAAFRASSWRRRHVRPNLGLTVMMLVLNFGLAVVVFGAERDSAGGLLQRHLPPAVVVLVGVVVLDFATYVGHWSMHRVRLLWRVHRVHHADPFVDVTTTLRHHPLEGMLRFALVAVPAIALGLPAEVVAIYRLVSVMNGLLEHTNVRVWQPIDRILSLIVVTPNMHKMHHSKSQRETDSNFGNILSVFDRLFGTFLPAENVASVEYGLCGYDEPELQRLGELLHLPFGGDAR